jgi:carbon-monoxide dehydrogenase large subunit
VTEDLVFANGSQAVEVEVDIETGQVRIDRHVVVHDSGVIVNPMIVDGQIVGGVAHGIGNALYEWMRYDDSAQPLTTTLADYLLVSAPELPTIETAHMESPSPLNPLGVKGVGECGVVAAPAAVVDAIEDALAPFGVRIAETPVTPSYLRALVAEASH